VNSIESKPPALPSFIDDKMLYRLVKGLAAKVLVQVQTATAPSRGRSAVRPGCREPSLPNVTPLFFRTARRRARLPDDAAFRSSPDSAS
jgi:hypothetical protein